MPKNKRNRKTFEEIGEKWYEFDFQMEKAIYCYLCCNHVKKKLLRRLDDQLKFHSYQKWKQYIRDKYEKYNRDQLIEFSRYLNQKMRSIKPEREYFMLWIPVFATLVVTKLVDTICMLNFQGLNSILSFIIVDVIIIVCMLIPFMCFVIKISKPIWNDNISENFLRDYKEIIDEMIAMKKGGE